MIIDCHGHYTTVPPQAQAFRDQQVALGDGSLKPPSISDDTLRETLEGAQLRLQRERGIDVTIFSPRASAMGHHLGPPADNVVWAQFCNDIIARVCNLYPKNFVPVAQLPQHPAGDLASSIRELERCVNELGFVGANLNPDPSGGNWTGRPLTDKYWYPMYEKLVELDVPAMIHVSATCNPNFHATGAHYLNADTTAFMQLLLGDLFKDFPTLRLIIPHGGGAVPYHWGRYRGIAQDAKRPTLEELMGKNVFFDTCVYHKPGMELLLEVVPHDNLLFGTEMVGAVRGIDPRTDHYYDDTKWYLDEIGLSPELQKKLFSENTLNVFPRMRKSPAILGA
jgi:4-oxalmesaconate hydratase